MPKSAYDTPKALVSQDIAGVAGIARFEIADNSSFTDATKTPWQQALARHDFIVKYHLQKLKAGTSYYMRVRFGFSKDQTQTGPISQFATLPAQDSGNSVSFAVSSCINLSHFFLGHHYKNNSKPWNQPVKGRDRKLGYPALETIEKLQPAFWVQTGDSVYYDQPKSYKAQTKKELRAKWHRQMALPRMQSLLQRVPAYWMVDDHDFRYNDSDDSNPDKNLRLI